MSCSHGHLSRCAVLAFSFSLAACSIHPIPDDVSRYDTAEIVRNVRCEVKAAVRAKIIEGLHKEHIFDVANPDHVLADPAVFAKVRRQSPRLAAKFKAYGVSTISYAFEFDITENNKNSGDLLFKLPFTSGGDFSLSLEGQLDKTRKAVRKFRTVEQFQDLAKLRCEDWEQPAPNALYPLTGSIGIGTVVKTFINLSEMGSLDPARFTTEEEKYFTDVIKFTTELDGSLKPKLVLKEVADRFRLTTANLNRSSGRTDKHEVTACLSP